MNRRTPGTVYRLPPKATPGNTTTDSHFRVRQNRVDATGTITLPHAGRLHHIGIGRAHAGTPIIAIVNDLDIRIFNTTTTGEPHRQLTLDATRDHQPINSKGPNH